MLLLFLIVLIFRAFSVGSILSSACFFTGKPISALFAFLKSCGSKDCDKECDNSEFVNWIIDLPNVLAMIEAVKEFPMLFNKFETIIISKYDEFQQKLDSTTKSLTDYGFVSDVKIIFAPTILQSVDYAFVDARLYVIASDYSETAALHEYLHPVIGEFRPQLEGFIEFCGIEKFVNPSEMLKIGYMTDFSLQSKCHALEDCIIRGIVGVIATTVSLEDYCKMNTEMGFLFVPQLIQYAKQIKPTKDNLIEFIFRALNLAV
jgi:hypothetical protein